MTLGHRPQDKAVRQLLTKTPLDGAWEQTLKVAGINTPASDFYCQQLDLVVQLLANVSGQPIPDVPLDVIQDVWYHTIGEFKPLLDYIRGRLKEHLGDEVTEELVDLAVWAFVMSSITWWGERKNEN